MRGPLPVYIQDPVARLTVVSRAMDDLKQLQAGGRRLDARGGQRHRTSGGAGAGLEAPVLDAPVQPAGHQHPGAAGSALHPRPPASGPVPARVPASGTRAGCGDHVVQRPGRVRPARRLRRPARHRRWSPRVSTNALAELLAVAEASVQSSNGRPSAQAIGATSAPLLPTSHRRRGQWTGRRYAGQALAANRAQRQTRADGEGPDPWLTSFHDRKNLICLTLLPRVIKRLPGTYMELPPTPAPVGIRPVSAGS